MLSTWLIVIGLILMIPLWIFLFNMGRYTLEKIWNYSDPLGLYLIGLALLCVSVGAGITLLIFGLIGIL